MRKFLLSSAALSLLAVSATAQCDVTSLYAANNGGSVGGMVYIDLNVTTATRITGFSVNTTIAVNTAIGLNVFTRVGSYVGQTTSIANWGGAPVSTGTGVAAGANLPSLVTLNTPLILTPGSYGVALGSVAFNHRYTNFAVLQNYPGPNYTLTAGAAGNTPFGAGAPFSPRVFNGTIHCTSATGLFPDFTATPTSGPSPLNVQFTDTTYTSDLNGVQTWAWDLDGDNIVDSNAQNPSFTYNTCGRVDVTLSVTDTMNPAASLTKSQYVVVDPQLLVSASFTAAPSAGPCPLNTNFTDTSTGSPTSWAWDLDGDNIVDSNAQNPSFTYTVAGSYDVTLTASNACGSSTRTVVAAVACVANDECSTAIPIADGPNGPYSNVGATNSFLWTCGTVTNVTRDVWFSYTPGCNVSVEINTCSNALPPTDTQLSVHTGVCGSLTELACNDDAVVPCAASTLQSRVTGISMMGGQTYYIAVCGWNGTVGSFSIEVVSTPSGSGSLMPVSPGCGGTGLFSTGNPNIGGSVNFTMAPVQASPFMTLGFVPLGIQICAGGCILGSTMDVVVSGSTLGGSIPCDPLLIGGTIYAQGLDLGASGGCASNDPVLLTLSDTIRLIIG